MAKTVFKPIKNPSRKTLVFSSTEMVLIITKSGYEDLYHVVEEDAYMEGKYSLMTKDSITEKYGISDGNINI